MSTYEPPPLEITITRFMGYVISPFYRSYARSLKLTGSERLIDFGSGSGNLSRHLAALLNKPGGHLTCMDVSHLWQVEIRKVLRPFTNVSFVESSIQAANLPTDSFDAAVIHYVLHDIPISERPEIAACLVSKLVPGGRLYIREPNQPAEGMPPETIRALFEPCGITTQFCSAARSRLAGPMSLYNGIRK